MPKAASSRSSRTLPMASSRCFSHVFPMTHFFSTAVCQTHLCCCAPSLESRAARREREQERGERETCLSHWLSRPGHKHFQIFYEVGGKTACAIYTVREKHCLPVGRYIRPLEFSGTDLHLDFLTAHIHTKPHISPRMVEAQQNQQPWPDGGHPQAL